jgi:hypothetical protein
LRTNVTLQHLKSSSKNQQKKVSPLSVNWDCRTASWTNTSQGSDNQCTFPEQLFDATASFLFGVCEFPTVTQSQLALSDEVLGVAAQPATQAKLPRRNNAIQASETSYWAEMAKGTKLTYPSSRLSQTSAPVVWNYQQCMEIDSQVRFWHTNAVVCAGAYNQPTKRHN